MDMNRYQSVAHASSGYNLKDKDAVVYCVFGIMRGIGEMSHETKHLIKESNRNSKTRSVAKVAHEAGNVLWYLAELCSVAGIDLNTVARRSLENV